MKPGNLRFCNENCHSGHVADLAHGVITFGRFYATEGCCSYCADYVPTNAERRAA